MKLLGGPKSVRPPHGTGRGFPHWLGRSFPLRQGLAPSPSSGVTPSLSALVSVYFFFSPFFFSFHSSVRSFIGFPSFPLPPVFFLFPSPARDNNFIGRSSRGSCRYRVAFSLGSISFALLNRLVVRTLPLPLFSAPSSCFSSARTDNNDRPALSDASVMLIERLERLYAGKLTHQ